VLYAISQTKDAGVLTSRDCERDHNDREVMVMITSAVGILLFGLGVLGLAIATAVHDTWWLQRKMKKTIEHQESLREAA
jgi:hypothetical protein